MGNLPRGNRGSLAYRLGACLMYGICPGTGAAYRTANLDESESRLLPSLTSGELNLAPLEGAIESPPPFFLISAKLMGRTAHTSSDFNEENNIRCVGNDGYFFSIETNKI